MTQIIDDIPVFADEAEELEFLVRDLDAKYQIGDDTIHPITGLIVGNGEYDSMISRLREIKPDSEVFQGTQPSDIQTKSKKVTHNPPLTSITKANGTWDEKVARLKKFFELCCSRLDYTLPDNFGQPDDNSLLFAQELKIDGASLALYYEPNNKGETVLMRAGLRPRGGIEGRDVSLNVRYIQNIPQVLPVKNVRVSIRGEAYVSKSVFNRVNPALLDAGKIDKLFSNTRNYVAGSICQFDEPETTAERELAFKFHGMQNLSLPKSCGIEYPITQIDKAKLAASWGFETVNVIGFRWLDAERFEKGIPVLDYGIDGLVIKVNNVDDYEQMGNEGDDPIKEPRGAIAWKFPDEEAEVRIEKVVWQVARTGDLTPVGYWEKPVRLADTNVKRCTLHSLGYMRKKQIKLGCTGTIKKSGMIIPDFIRVTSGEGEPEYPENCPECGQKTTVEKGGKDSEGDYTYSLVCNNPFCVAQISNTLVHYLQTFGCKGLGGAQVRKMYDAQIIATPADFYTLDIPTLVKAGLSERQSLIALGAIHMIDKASKKEDKELTRLLGSAISQKKKVPVWQLFGSFGIHHAGRDAGKKLQDHFGSFDGVVKATYDDLIQIPGIGPITADSISTFFMAQSNMITNLLKYVEPVGPKIGVLSGITFCLSGSFENGKDYWERLIEDAGGKTTGSCGKALARVDSDGSPMGYLIEGPDAGSKVQKAKDYGVPIITIDLLKKML